MFVTNAVHASWDILVTSRPCSGIPDLGSSFLRPDRLVKNAVHPTLIIFVSLKLIDMEESTTQRQARLRREKREQKILHGGSSRLDSIMSLSGRPAPEPGRLNPVR